MFREIKRLAVVGAAVTSLMYLGGTMHVHEKLHDMFEGNEQIELGYENPRDISIEKKVNEKGNVEGYVTLSNGQGTIALPILKGENGLQIGDSDYWWSTLSMQQRDGFVLTGWNDLSKSSKTSVVKNEFSNLDYGVMEELTEKGWNSLNPEKREELITNEWSGLSYGVKEKLTEHGWNSLNLEKRAEMVTNEWNSLGYDVKERLTELGWSSLNLEKKSEMVAGSWGQLGKETRYPLVRGDLEQALDSFYGINKNVDGEINELEVDENGNR